MDKRPLGRSGLHTAPLALGGNVFGWTADEATSFAVLDAYATAGGNFVDTADGYSAWVPGNKGGERASALVIAHPGPAHPLAQAVQAPYHEHDRHQQNDVSREVPECTAHDGDERHQPAPQRKPGQGAPGE